MAVALDAVWVRVKNVCKQNGLLIMSVLAVVIGCLLGFFLRTRHLTEQVSLSPPLDPVWRHAGRRGALDPCASYSIHCASLVWLYFCPSKWSANSTGLCRFWSLCFTPFMYFLLTVHHLKNISCSLSPCSICILSSNIYCFPDWNFTATYARILSFCQFSQLNELQMTHFPEIATWLHCPINAQSGKPTLDS